MLRLTVYVPATHVDNLKAALFDAGAGRLGQYDQCCWQVKGQGQFRPLSGSQPFLGHTHQLETVDEYRLEFIVIESSLKTIIDAMKQHHPYEQPAFDVVQLIDIP